MHRSHGCLGDTVHTVPLLQKGLLYWLVGRERW